MDIRVKWSFMRNIKITNTNLWLVGVAFFGKYIKFHFLSLFHMTIVYLVCSDEEMH